MLDDIDARLQPPRRLTRWARRLGALVRGRGRLPILHDARYRLPITSLNARHGVEVRRADFVVWYLTISGLVPTSQVRAPEPVSYTDIARVHTEDLLRRLTDGPALAQVFHTDPHELRVEDVMLSVRLACGGTLDGARLALERGGPVLNTLGGFHHAGPDTVGGLCPLNDIAIAVATLRAEGLTAPVAVLDLDAHPPDGTAACLEGDEATWIGSLSGSDWGPVPGADETVLPRGCDDDTYLTALRDLLGRMPRAALVFVIAGGDVIDGDRMGQLGLSPDGVRRRDLTVHHALRDTPSVWVPGGGYSSDAWRLLAGTGLVLAGYGRRRIPDDVSPEDLQYDRIARSLDRSRLQGTDAEHDWLDAAELEAELGLQRPPPRLLGTYTVEGLRYAFDAYGILGQLRRLGYDDFRVTIDRAGVGERLRLYGRDEYGVEGLLMEAVVELRHALGRPVLFIHWLTLRHPRGTFVEARPRLPGQDVPGLGMSLEAVELLERATRRVGAEGLAMVPSFFHTAWPPKPGAHFVDAERQGRYEALVRDLGGLGRAGVSQALSQGRVRLDGRPYTWEATEMVSWLDGERRLDPDVVERERERVRFTVAPGG